MIIIILLKLICQTLEGIAVIPDFTRYVETNTWNTTNTAFGIVTKFYPLGAKFYNYQQYGVDITYFLNSGINENSQLFYLHYLEISFSKDSIIHHVLFYQDGTWLQFEFPFDKLTYEGKWFHQYVYFDGTTKEIVVGMIWGNNIKKYYRTSYQNLINVKITSIYGEEFNDLHPITNEKVYFQVFPGSTYKSTLTSISKVNNFANLNLDKFVCSNTFLHQWDMIKINQSNQYQLYMIDKTNYFYYKIQFWSKVQDSFNIDLDQIIHIIRVAANRFISSLTVTGSNSFILEYVYDYLTKQWFLDIKYYSYTMPIIMNNINDPFQNHQLIQIPDFSLISNWHLITIEYTGTKLNFDLQNKQLNFRLTKNYDKIYQFSSIYYRLFMGGWPDSYNQMETNFALIYFYDCANIQETICHYSCQTCFGPLANNCISCPTGAFRQFNSQSNTCNCQLWYTEQSNHLCTFSTYADSIVDQVESQIDSCQFGYFQYENECYKCPSASQSNQVACTECLMRPNDWIYTKASCLNIYYQNNDPQSTYVKQSLQGSIENIQYLFLNGELLSCNGCVICQDKMASLCFLSQYQHLNQPTYIKCLQGYTFNQGLCQYTPPKSLIQVMCSKNCLVCDKICLKCIDQEQYFIDFSGKCQQCSIPHCKYCFQINIFNLGSNSLFQSEEFLAFDDYLIGCALCSEQYHFSFELNQCIRNTLTMEDCNFYTLHGTKQCYSTSLSSQTNQYQQISDCQHYIPYCQDCVRDQFGFLLCIVCQQGYYINNMNSFCNSCQEQVRSCTADSIDLQGYKLQFAGLVQFLGQKYQNLNIQQMSIIRTVECNDGMILDQHNNQCIQSCKNCSECTFIDSQLQCLKCDAQNEQINYYSQKDGTCFKCPYPCKFCLPLDPDQIFEYNPYFILTESTKYQTYKCLKNYNDNLTYIHSQSGLLKPLVEQIPSEFRIQIKDSMFDIMSDISNLVSNSVSQLVNRNDFNSNPILNLVYSLNNYTQIISQKWQGFNDLALYQNYNNMTDLIFYYNTFIGANPMFNFDSTYGIRVQVSHIQLNQTINNNLVIFSNIKTLTISTITINVTKITDSSIFLFKNFYQPTQIQISNIYFFNTTLQNTTFLKFLEGNQNQFQIDNLTFINCTFISSSFISQLKDTFNNQYIIKNITINNCIFLNSNFIYIPQSSDIFITQLLIQKSSFQNTTLLQTTSQISLTDCVIKSSNFTNGALFNLQLKSQNQEINIRDFQATSIILSSADVVLVSAAQQSIVGKFVVQNFVLQEILQLQSTSQNQHDYFIHAIKTNILLQNINIKMSLVFMFLKVEQSLSVQLFNIYFTQQNSTSLLDVYNQSHTFIGIQNCQHLLLQNFTFMNLTKVNHPLIYVQVQNYDIEDIIIQQFRFSNNLNIIKSLSSIIFIYVDNACQIQITNSEFQNNRFYYNVSNQDVSTSSLIKIKSSKANVLLQNTLFSNNSIHNSSDAQIYFVATSIVLHNISAHSINYQVSYSLCGFGVFQGENISIINSTFNDIRSIYYGIFYIELRLRGLLFIKNCSFSNTDKSNQVQKGGVLTIDGSQSSIQLNIEDLTIHNITSQILAAFIYLFPSQITNQIVLKNILIFDMLSADQSFANFDFPNSNSLNFIKIYNVFIRNLNKNPQSLNMKGFLTASNSDIVMVNFTYIGILYQPLLFFYEMNKVTLYQFQLVNITLSYSYSYFFSIQSLQNTILSEITIQNVFTDNIQNHFLLFNSHIIISKLIVLQVSCQNCQNGLINFIGTNKQIKCTTLSIQANDCGSNCLVSSQSLIFIENSLIINNRASQLGLFYITKSTLVLKNLFFKSNIVKMNGGALYVNDCNITLQYVYLINNTAQIGGAIFYADGKFNKSQLKQLYLYENVGIVAMNNIRENPDFLKLLTYSIILQNKQEKNDQLRIDTPKYIVNHKQQRINSSFIMVSSGYSVQDSEAFDKTSMKYNKTNISLKLYQFTQLGELAIDTTQNKCFVRQYYIDETLNISSINNENLTTLQFNSTFYSMDDLTIQLDPYLNSSYYMLIDCQCDSFLDNNYHFQFKIKTLKCGLGQYYKDSICHKCDSENGYFSVEKNSLECQRMDPKRIKNLTSSSLELKPGYWRYNYYSSQIEQCQAYSKYCLGGWTVNYNSCSLGYIGALCEECDIYNIRGDSQYVKSISGYCFQKTLSWEQFITLFLVMLILFLITYVLVKNYHNIQQNYKKLKMQSFYFKILFKYSSDLMNPLIKQSISLLQILYLLLPSSLGYNYSQIIWPLGNPSKIVLLFIDLVADRIPIPIIYANVIGSIILPFAQIIIFILVFITHRRATQLKFDIYSLGLFLLIYSMPNIIEQLASLMSSRDITVQWIGGNVSYLYYTAEHIHWLIYFLIPATIFFILIFPGYLFYSMNRDLHNNDIANGYVGYFAQPYVQRFYFWELINNEMLLIVAFLTSYLNPINVILKDVSVIVILYIYYSGVSYYKPYLYRRLNQIQKVSIAFSCFIASICCILEQAELDDLLIVQYLTAIIIVSLLIALLFYLFINIIIGYYNKYNENFDTARQLIKRKFPDIEIKCPILKPLLQNKGETKRKVYKRFQFMKTQLRTLKLNNSRIGRTALINDDHGVIISNIQRQSISRLIISSPMQYIN